MKKLGSIFAGNLIVLPSFVLLLTLIMTVSACDQGDQGGQTYPTPTRAPAQTTKPSATVLLSQEIAPSDQEQVVSWRDQLKVTIPAGLVDSKQTLTIATTPDLPPNPFKGFGPLLAFDVSLGSLRNFKKQLTIEVVYDPSKIVSDLPPEKALRAAYWNTEAKTWVSSRVQVDTSRNVVIIRTDHLTSWKVHYLRRGYGVNETDRFTIVYEKSVWPMVGPDSGLPQEPVNFAKQVGDYLDYAWSQYIFKGYLPRPNDVAWREYERFINPIPTPINPYNPPPIRTESPRILVFIDQNTTESITHTLSGDTYLKTRYLTMNEVRHDAAHELFHHFQREISIPDYLAKHWWMEATADYAADKVAWGGMNTMAVVNEDYFGFPLDHADGIHDYATSRFVDYLVRKGIDFKQLWDESVRSRDSALTFLENFVTRRNQTSLHDHYKGFAEYILFDGSSPTDKEFSLLGVGPNRRGGLKEEKAPAALAADKNEMAYSFALGRGYTAKLWGFTVANKDPKTPRALKIEATGIVPPASDVDANVYVLKINNPRPRGGVASRPDTINSNKKSVSITVGADEVVMVLAVNTGASDQSLSVKVTDNNLTISPPSASLNPGQNITFTTPGVTEKVLWSVQEGSSGGTIGSAGVYTAPASSGTYHVVATLDSDRTRTATATVTVIAPTPTTAPSTPSDLQKTKHMELKGGWYAASELTQRGRTGPTGPSFIQFEALSIPITWSGSSFSGKLEKSGNAGSALEQTTETVSGSVSADGSMVVSLQYSLEGKFMTGTGAYGTESRQVVLKNVPLKGRLLYHDWWSEVGGASVTNHISNFSNVRNAGVGWEDRHHMPVTGTGLSDSYLRLIFY